MNIPLPSSLSPGKRPLRRTPLLILQGLSVALLLLIFTSPAHARHAGYPEWQKPKHCIFVMPYIGRAVGPDETGMVTEILKEIFEGREQDFEHRHLPYDRALAELKQGIAHCSLALEGHHDLEVQGETTIAVFNLAVAYRIKDDFPGVDGMEGQRVATMYGFELQDLLPVKVLVQSGYDLASSLQLLDRGQVKYVLDEAALMREAILEAKLPTSEFGIAMISSLKVHPVFAPTETGREFRDLYDRRIKEMAESGRLREIYRANGLSDDKIDQLFRINGF